MLWFVFNLCIYVAICVGRKNAVIAYTIFSVVGNHLPLLGSSLSLLSRQASSKDLG